MDFIPLAPAGTSLVTCTVVRICQGNYFALIELVQGVQDTSTVSCTRFLAGFFRQEGIFSHHFYQEFRNCWPFVI